MKTLRCAYIYISLSRLHSTILCARSGNSFTAKENRALQSAFISADVALILMSYSHPSRAHSCICFIITLDIWGVERVYIGSRLLPRLWFIDFRRSSVYCADGETGIIL